MKRKFGPNYIARSLGISARKCGLSRCDVDMLQHDLVHQLFQEAPTDRQVERFEQNALTMFDHSGINSDQGESR